MKRNIFLFVLLAPSLAFADAPSTSCPSGYIAIDAPYITVATNCPSGTVEIGDNGAYSCLVSNPSRNCIMYAPVGMSFTDDSGTYEYTEPCVMK